MLHSNAVFEHGLSTSGFLIVSMFIQISDLHFDYVNNKVHIGSELTRFLCETIKNFHNYIFTKQGIVCSTFNTTK